MDLRGVKLFAVKWLVAAHAFWGTLGFAGIELTVSDLGETYSWTETKCHYVKDHGEPTGEIEITALSVNDNASVKGSSIQIRIPNFSNIMNGATPLEPKQVVITHPSSGEIIFKDRRNIRWGNLSLRDLKSSCELEFNESDNEQNIFDISAHCRNLGQVEKKSGPRFHFTLQAKSVLCPLQ